MSLELSISEIFELAEQIEQDASAFYRQAAAATRDPRRRRLLTKLESLESDHERIFAGMKAALAAGERAPGRLSAGNRPERDWPTLAKFMASGVNEYLEESFTGRESGEDVLRKAIDFEKETLVFFASVKNALGDPQDKQKIDAILREELGHILSLTSELASGE